MMGRIKEFKRKNKILERTSKNNRRDALQIFKAAVDAVKPGKMMRQHLCSEDKSIRIGSQIIAFDSFNKLFVIAAGKAAAAMAEQAEQQLGDHLTRGICITKYDHGLPLRKFKLIESAHPIPDENSLLAGAEVASLLSTVTKRDVVLVLLSGGASSLMEHLPEGLLLHEVQQVIYALVRCGANIHEINSVRKHISKLKGGGLAKAAFPARVYTLILSDVAGDNLDVIASGPTVADTSTFDDALAILTKYNLWQSIPANIQLHLKKGINREIGDTPKAGDDIFKNCFTTIIGNNHIALHAAETEAKILGYKTGVFKENVSDNTEILARQMIREFHVYGGTLPACFLSGGETTVEVKGNGKGGRNQHFVLCALDEMINCCSTNYKYNITVLSAGTDGTDGPTDAAGAIAELKTFILLPDVKADLHESLDNFNSYAFFEKYDALIRTGPTQTNVMDIMMVIISL